MISDHLNLVVAPVVQQRRPHRLPRLHRSPEPLRLGSFLPGWRIETCLLQFNIDFWWHTFYCKMARYTLTVLSLSVVVALVVELVSCCSSTGPTYPNPHPGMPGPYNPGPYNPGPYNPFDPNPGRPTFPRFLHRIARNIYGKAEENAGRGLTHPKDARRRRSTDNALVDEEASRKLFDIFDLNEDGRIDVVDWSAEGGRVVSFSDLIVAHDIDGDEKLSLEEFLQIPDVPDLGLGRALGRDDVIQGDEAIRNPGQD